MHLCTVKCKLYNKLFLRNIFLFHIHLNCPLGEVVIISTLFGDSHPFPTGEGVIGFCSSETTASLGIMHFSEAPYKYG